MSREGFIGWLLATALAFFILGGVFTLEINKRKGISNLAAELHDHSWHHENKGALMYRMIGDLDGCAIYEGTIRGQKYVFAKGCSVTPKVPHE